MISDEALFEALLGGDLRAFDTLYGRHERLLFGFILKYLSDAADAEDVLHETFMAILRDREGARAAKSLRAWMLQVARHLCLNRLRSLQRADRASKKETLVTQAAAPSPEGALEQRQSLLALKQAVAKLPIELAELFHLRSGGMSYEEMAEALSVPLGTVKSRMNKMMNHLREEMQR